MARRYTRDRRGRFTSSGAGATARGGRLTTAGGKRYQRQTMTASASAPAGAMRGRVKRDPGAMGKVGANRKMAPKVDLSQASFERRAKATEKRARAAEKAAAGLDRSNPGNSRAVNRANALRNAADRYSAIVRKSARGEFTAAEISRGGRKYSTAPKLSPAEKAKRTKAKKQAERDESNRRRWEASRRYG